MDWELAIDRNRTALLAIIVALMTSLGLRFGGAPASLPQFLYAKALVTLRQAESAVRRLIVIAAHALAVRGFTLAKPRVSSTNFATRRSPGQTRVPSFNLIDPLKAFGREAPDFTAFDPISFDEFSSTNKTPVCAASLKARILALKQALDAIPKHAKRLARWYAARDLALSQNQPHRLSPIRPGPPPASRRHKRTEMDAILSECHSLAIYARDSHDSS
jgi:hypothetical protein